jgi:demethylsterigmatocystin 6-O-methyltransferase
MKILQNIIPALDKDSRILLDDKVLPNSGVHWRAASADIAMMTVLGARERTEDQWHALLDRVGLKILDIHTYDLTGGTSVIVAVPQ